MAYFEHFKYGCCRCGGSFTRLEAGATKIGDDYYCDSCIAEVEDEVDWSKCSFSSFRHIVGSIDKVYQEKFEEKRVKAKKKML